MNKILLMLSAMILAGSNVSVGSELSEATSERDQPAEGSQVFDLRSQIFSLLGAISERRVFDLRSPILSLLSTISESRKIDIERDPKVDLLSQIKVAIDDNNSEESQRLFELFLEGGYPSRTFLEYEGDPINHAIFKKNETIAIDLINRLARSEPAIFSPWSAEKYDFTGVAFSEALKQITSRTPTTDPKLNNGEIGLGYLMDSIKYVCKNVVNRVIELGVDVDSWDGHSTPLLTSIEALPSEDNLEIIRSLIEDHHANVNIKHHRYYMEETTLLHEAVSVGVYLRTIRLLLEHGADITAKDSKGRTPLHCAYSVENACLLLSAPHAEDVINAIDSDNKTPLDIAISRSEWHPGLADIFREHGAKTYEELSAEVAPSDA